ncbi:hypothetical protein AB0K43_25550 [Kitasatospora sp. NPDC049258]|uniref:hypothetical protein n=1 Tax=Kitasatospora sp. NPDC049258 TaxID=3155394 RepID=UPI003442411E
MKSFIESAPFPLVIGLSVAGLLLNAGLVFVLCPSRKQRLTAAMGFVLGGVWIIPVGVLRGDSAKHIVVLYADALLLVALILIGLRADVRRVSVARAAGDRDIPPIPEARGRRVVYASMGLVVLVILLEYLPIWPF